MTDHITLYDILTVQAAALLPGLLLASIVQAYIVRRAGWGFWRVAALLVGALVNELVLSLAIWITPALRIVFVLIPPPEFLPTVMQIAFPGLVANLVSVVFTTVFVWLIWRRKGPERLPLALMKCESWQGRLPGLPCPPRDSGSPPSRG